MATFFLNISLLSFVGLKLSHNYYLQKQYEKEEKIRQEIREQEKINEKIQHIKEVRKAFNINGSDEEVLKEYDRASNFIINCVDEYNTKLDKYYNEKEYVKGRGGLLQITRWEIITLNHHIKDLMMLSVQKNYMIN